MFVCKSYWNMALIEILPWNCVQMPWIIHTYFVPQVYKWYWKVFLCNWSFAHWVQFSFRKQLILSLNSTKECSVWYTHIQVRAMWEFFWAKKTPMLRRDSENTWMAVMQSEPFSSFWQNVCRTFSKDIRFLCCYRTRIRA